MPIYFLKEQCYATANKKRKSHDSEKEGEKNINIIEIDGYFLTLTDIYSKENLLCQRDLQKRCLLKGRKKFTETNMTIQK